MIFCTARMICSDMNWEGSVPWAQVEAGDMATGQTSEGRQAGLRGSSLTLRQGWGREVGRAFFFFK